MPDSIAITTWVAPISQVPPEATSKDCAARAKDVRAGGVFVCTRPWGHGGEVHVSHGTHSATLWTTKQEREQA